jgi:hypothetical protein
MWKPAPLRRLLLLALSLALITLLAATLATATLLVALIVAVLAVAAGIGLTTLARALTLRTGILLGRWVVRIPFLPLVILVRSVVSHLSLPCGRPWP